MARRWHALGACALVVLAVMTAGMHMHAPRAPNPARRSGGFGKWTNATAKLPPAKTAKALVTTTNATVTRPSAHSPALAVPLVPLQPRGAPFWVSNVSTHAGTQNKTEPVG